jgi:hypothetical protein
MQAGAETTSHATAHSSHPPAVPHCGCFRLLLLAGAAGDCCLEGEGAGDAVGAFSMLSRAPASPETRRIGPAPSGRH